tara:strand:+ start:1589 stop:1849 length:261 start_codon:yes stop_codon:yes gene_type:complete
VSIKVKNKNNKKLEKELSKKINLFGKAPDHCLTCHKKFDKANKEMVTSWYVIVRNQEEKVRLYCPTCWEKAQDFIERLKNDKRNIE